MSIVSMADTTVDNILVEDVARVLAVDVARARRCIGIASLALFAMLCGKGSTAPGGAAVFDAVRDGRDLAALLGEDEAAVLVRAVGLCAGIDARQSTDLLAMLLPVALGAIGREVEGRELDKTGLSRFLSAQRAGLDDALPADLAEPMRGSRHFDALRAGFAADAPMTDTSEPDAAVLAEAEYDRTVRKPTAMRLGIVAVPVLLAVAWFLYVSGMREGASPAPAEIVREIPAP